MKDALKFALGVLIGLLLSGVILLVARPPEGNPVTLEPPPTPGPLTIHVTGAVVSPGVYQLPRSGRVETAIQAAGGLLAQADVGNINLAAPVEDGSQVDVPFIPTPTPTIDPTVVLVLPTAARSGPTIFNKVNINTASQEELESLPGIGPALATQIIAYRDANGPFKKIEDLVDVPGIGPKTYEKVKDLITT